MKKPYVTPVAVEECFEPNSYIAACEYRTTGTANGMRCVNPYHAHYGQYYFAGVWIEGVAACTTVVTSDSTKSSGGGYMPDAYSVVYLAGLDPSSNHVVADTPVAVRGSQYYVPAEVAAEQASSFCYGIYKHDGTAITEKVMS